MIDCPLPPLHADFQVDGGAPLKQNPWRNRPREKTPRIYLDELYGHKYDPYIQLLVDFVR